MKKDTIRIQPIKDAEGPIAYFEVEILDATFNTVYRGRMSVTEYANVISGAYEYCSIESDR